MASSSMLKSSPRDSGGGIVWQHRFALVSKSKISGVIVLYGPAPKVATLEDLGRTPM